MHARSHVTLSSTREYVAVLVYFVSQNERGYETGSMPSIESIRVVATLKLNMRWSYHHDLGRESETLPTLFITNNNI